VSEKNRATVELRFADRDPITVWDSVTLRQNYIQPVDDLQFVVSNPNVAKRDSYLSRLQKGERVTLWINGSQQATAEVTSVQGSISRRNGWTLQVTCKTLLHAAVEGAVDPFYGKNLDVDTPLESVVLDVLRPYGFDSLETDTAADVAAISGKSLSGRADPVVLSDVKLKDFKAPHGGNASAYQYAAALFSRFGLALRTDRRGRLILGQPDFDQAAAYTVEQVRGVYAGDPMTGDISWSDTNDGQFSHYVVVGKAPKGAKATSASPPVSGVIIPDYTLDADLPFGKDKFEALKPGRHLYRSRFSPYKPHMMRDDKCRDVDRCVSWARMVAMQRAASGFQVKCTVDGLVSKTKHIWTIDTVGRVVVNDIAIDERMWLLETTKHAKRQGGQHTELTWVPLNSLDLRSA
jgi:prophage tail gpP-like protein